MILPGLALFIMGFVYYRWTKDFPKGNIEDLRRQGLVPPRSDLKGSFREAMKDPRVWALFVMYGASFGVELTIDNVAALYFTDRFHLALLQAGLVAGLFGFMNIFARALGGFCSDRCARHGGLRARVKFLGISLFIGGVMLMVFSKMTTLPLAIAMMIIFALFIKVANGANYSIVPFINKRALGAVAGIVGAGGNVGGMLFGFLFRQKSLSYSDGIFYLGCFVVLAASMAVFVRFSTQVEQEAKEAFHAAQTKKMELQMA